MVNSVLDHSINTSQNPQSSSTEKKIYINSKTGSVIDLINTNDPTNNGQYIEVSGDQKVFVNIQRKYSDNSDLVSLAGDQGGIAMSALQYEEFKKLSNQVIKIHSDASSGQEKNKIILSAMQTIVDSKVDCGEQSSDMKRLELYALIKILGKDNIQPIVNNPISPNQTSNTSAPVSDNQAELDALRGRLNNDNNNPQTNNSSLNTLNSQPQSPLGFFKQKLYRQQTGLLWKPVLIQNSTNIIDGVEIKGKSIAISGNGLRLRRARSNVLLNKMITKLESNDPKVVMEAIMSYKKRGAGIVPRFLHRKKLINTLKDPVRLDKKFNKKVGMYMENTARNLEPAQQQILIQAFNNVKNAIYQQNINQLQGMMTGSDLSSLAGQYNPN